LVVFSNGTIGSDVLAADQVNEIGRGLGMSERETMRSVEVLRDNGFIALRWGGQVFLTAMIRQYYDIKISG
jgi:hypothetical protein